MWPASWKLNKATMNFLQNLTKPFVIIYYAIIRFINDDCFSKASSLAYTTLFALIPISVMMFQFLPAFGLKKQQIDIVANAVLEVVLPNIEELNLINANDKDVFLFPETSLLEENQIRSAPIINNKSGTFSTQETSNRLREMIYTSMKSFSQKASTLTTLMSLVTIFLSGALMFNTIESALNTVWKTSASTGIISRLMSCWAIFSLGALSVVAFYISWQETITKLSDTFYYIEPSVFSTLNTSLPIVLIAIAFYLMFKSLPATKVRVKDAAFGAIISTLFFFVAKESFSYYIQASTSYRILWGTLMTIPIFMIWLWVAWCITLLGAEVACQSGLEEISFSIKRYVTSLGESGALLGMKILFCISKNFSLGELPPNEATLALETGADPATIRMCLERLVAGNLITEAGDKNSNRSLLRSPDKITLKEVLQIFSDKEESKTQDFRKFKASHPLILQIIEKTFNHIEKTKKITDWTINDLILADKDSDAIDKKSWIID